MKTKLFAIFPGIVFSKNDGQRHHISGRSLIELYNLDPEECIIHTANDRTRGWLVNLIPLGPRSKGDYSDHLFVSLVHRIEEMQGEAVGVS